MGLFDKFKKKKTATETMEYLSTDQEIQKNGNDVGERGLAEKTARRLRSNTYIKEKQIACLESLPLTESSDEVTIKSVDERCKRAIACLISVQLACDISSGNDYDVSKEFFEKLLRQYQVENELIEKERKLFEGTYTDQDAVDVAWTYETYWAVVWSLGLVEDIKASGEICDCERAIALVSECESFEDFKNQCHPRTVEEILDMLDLYYRYHWVCVEYTLNPETKIGDLDPEVVCERRRGLEWLVSEESDWNEILLDT